MTRALVVLFTSVVASGCMTSGTGGSRHVPLEGQPNFRDLGGYETADGRTVRWGEVYRSGELPELTDADVAKLADLEIKTVVNFLTAAELERDGLDRLPPGTETSALPMEAGNMGELARLIIQARETGNFAEVPPELNPDIHRKLMEQGRDNYAALLRAVADPAQRPVVFHCSHGIHRTGTGAAILLSALGVPWETVREDYLLSNKYREEEVQRRLDELAELYARNYDVPVAEVDRTNMEAFYVLQGSYIDASREWAVQKYGSMDAYIREGLGITEEEIDQLKAELLVE